MFHLLVQPKLRIFHENLQKSFNVLAQEVLTESGWIKIGPALPKSFYIPCIMAVNKTSILLIAGSIKGEKEFSDATFIFNSETSHWVSGPSLIQPTRAFGCGLVPDKLNGDKNLFVVAGGENVGALVQMLMQVDGKWFKGDLRIMILFMPTCTKLKIQLCPN